MNARTGDWGLGAQGLVEACITRPGALAPDPRPRVPSSPAAPSPQPPLPWLSHV